MSRDQGDGAEGAEDMTVGGNDDEEDEEDGEDGDGGLYEVERIVARRWNQRDRDYEYLVKWKVGTRRIHHVKLDYQTVSAFAFVARLARHPV